MAEEFVVSREFAALLQGPQHQRAVTEAAQLTPAWVDSNHDGAKFSMPILRGIYQTPRLSAGGNPTAGAWTEQVSAIAVGAQWLLNVMRGAARFVQHGVPTSTFIADTRFIGTGGRCARPASPAPWVALARRMDCDLRGQPMYRGRWRTICDDNRGRDGRAAPAGGAGARSRPGSCRRDPGTAGDRAQMNAAALPRPD